MRIINRDSQIVNIIKNNLSKSIELHLKQSSIFLSGFIKNIIILKTKTIISPTISEFTKNMTLISKIIFIINKYLFFFL